MVKYKMEENEKASEYFRYDRKSFKVAKTRVSDMTSLSDVLEYLLESKPPCMKVGDSMLGIDQHGLKKQVNGIADKIIIHGHSERGDRLRYLYHVLSKKLSEQEDFLKTIMKFVLEMSVNPTSILRLEVGSQIYSENPDEDMSGEENSVSDKELLKQILGEIGDFEEDNVISYSSESDLSEWSSDEESEESKKSSCEIVKPEIKVSQSFSDFSSIQFPKDEESKRLEMEEYWNKEAAKATTIHQTLAKNSYLPVPLKSQPVITGLMVLVAKFGEHWEWKHAVARGSERFIFPETSIIREILWQFSVLNPDSSPMFTSDWSLKPGVMTSSLTHASFSSMMQTFQTTLSSLHKLKIFVHATLHKSEVLQDSDNVTPKMLLSYAQGLSDYLNFISEDMQHIERQLKVSKLDETNAEQPCTTLIQLLKKVKLYSHSIEVLEELHSNNFKSLAEYQQHSNSMTEAPLSCLNVFFSLAKKLDAQTKPKTFGILMYVFTKCLHAFLEEINCAISLNWTEHIIFQRYQDVKISDTHFWTECISVLDFGNLEESNNNFLVPCLTDFAAKITAVLKTSEMLKQLDENSNKTIGYPPISVDVIDDFFHLIFPLRRCDPEPTSDPSSVLLIPDYETHFRFLGLEGTLEEDSAKTVLDHYLQTLYSDKKKKKNDTLNKSNVKWLLDLEHLPKINHWDALNDCLNQSYLPVCTKAKNCIHKIFQDYQVSTSLKTFREIILETREDFAKSVVALLSADMSSKRYKWEDPTARNPGFQKLLNDCYPEGRENFDIELKLDRSSDTNYSFVVKPHFPLNLVLLEDSIQGYLFVSKQLSKLRKNLWIINALNIKEFKLIEGVEPNRVLLFRFALLHFCSSLRAYLMLKIFGKDLNFCTTNSSYELDQIRQVHGDHLKTVEIELLKSPVMEKIILRKMGEMTDSLQRLWTVGIPSRTMVLLEDTLKKCWNVIHDFRKNSNDFNELSYHFGPTPSYL